MNKEIKIKKSMFILYVIRKNIYRMIILVVLIQAHVSLFYIILISLIVFLELMN